MKKITILALVLALLLTAIGAMADATYTFDPEKPYEGVMVGLFEGVEITAEEEKGIATIYLPQGHEPWTPAVIVLTPEATTAAEFAKSETGMAWRDVADANKIGLAFLEPQDGGHWNLTLDAAGRNDAAMLNQLYMTMRSKSVKNAAPFSMDKTHTTVVGYGEGGAAALLCGAQLATDFSAICAVDAPAVSAEAMAAAGEMLVLPFPADHSNNTEDMQIQAKTVDTPVWFVNSAEANPDALAYYLAACDAQETEAAAPATATYAAKDNPAVRILISEEAQDAATIYDTFLSKTNRFMAMQDGGRVAFTVDITEPGFSWHEEEVGGELRRYITYVPSTYDPQQAVPLVLAIHGYTATAESMVQESRWFEVAEQNGFIVIFPQGMVREAPLMGNIPAACWVAGGFAALFGDVDPQVDINFINALIDMAQAEYNIDKSRIYCTGHSNGSMMTWELGVQSTERFAAIAPIGAMSSPSTDFSSDMLLPTWAIVGEFDSAATPEMVEGNATVAALQAWNAHNGTDERAPIAGEEYDGQWQTTTFANAQGVPLVRFTNVLRTAHIYMPEQAETVWNEFFSKYSRGEDGVIYYEGEAVTADAYVPADTWYAPAPAAQ